MSFQTTTRAIKNDILERCGELQDGTSPFEVAAMKYLNKVYQDVLAGGSEFGPDTAEPWNWAQAERPMPFKLEPAYSGAVTLTNDSSSGTLSAAPSYSLKGRYMRVDNLGDFYLVVSHAASTTGIVLDQKYLGSSGAVNAMFYKLDYDLVDDLIVVDSSNNKIDFSEDGTIELTATLTSGAYSPTSLCAELKTQLEAVGAETYTCTFNDATRMFTIVQGGTIFNLLFASGTNAATCASLILGFDIEDKTGALTYTSAYANSGILRLTKPITMYRDRNTYWDAAKDSGKIFHIDQNTFLREYPMNRLTQDVPDKFCLISQGKTGLTRARFNASVLDDPIRAEVNYIPVTRKLVDNNLSVPVVPGSYSDFLVYAAASLIMLDKSDSKAADYKALAQAKLAAMVNDNRKTTQLAGNNYGRMIPRSGPPTRAPGYGY